VNVEVSGLGVFPYSGLSGHLLGVSQILELSSHYLTNSIIFLEKKKIKCVFWFSLQFCLKHFSF